MTNMTSDDHGLRTIKEAAAYLHVSESTVRRMIRRGELPSRRIGAQIRLSLADLRPVGDDDYRPEPTSFPVPPWAEQKVSEWRDALGRIIAPAPGVQVIVIDRRGSKAFEVLRPPGFRWGVNLWHSDGLDLLTSDELATLFRGKKIYIFDEMVQRGRDLHQTKVQLAEADLTATSVCLVRRRSAFLDGELQDPDIVAIEDLGDRDFHAAAAFLSRLFDYCEPPLDPEHVLISGRTNNPNLAHTAVDLLAGFGDAGVVWNKLSREDAAITALTVDRPTFFDVSEAPLPPGFRATWDGPCKARPYIPYDTGHVTCAFICYPTLTADPSAWHELIRRTNARYSEVPLDPSLDDMRDTASNPHITRAYLDVCTDISVELLRQAVASGFLAQLGLTAPEAPDVDQLAAFFGRRRAIELAEQIRAALSEPLRLMMHRPGTIEGAIDPDRSVSFAAPPVRARQAILKQLPHRHDSPHTRAITYRELVEATRPIDETSISLALDGLIDGVDTKPVEVVEQVGEQLRVARAYVGSEYGDDLLGLSAVHSYDISQQRRTQAAAVLALATWLDHMQVRDETEITVAKLMVNLTWDWGSDPLAISPYPYKHGYVPALKTDVPYIGGDKRLLLRELVEACLLVEDRRGRSRRYRISPDLDLHSYIARSPLTGKERGQIRGLVRTYAAVQKNLKLERPDGPGSLDTKLYADSLIALSSARNEAIVYHAALFEIGDWIRIGRKTFRLLESLPHNASLSNDFRRAIDTDLIELAQAARFLFTKLSMYEAVPQLNAGLRDLSRVHELDLAEVVFDTLDTEARFELNYAVSKTPVGLTKRALDLMQPLSSLIRSALTQGGLLTDKRSPSERTTKDDSGGLVAKDAHYYAQRLTGALEDWSVSYQGMRLASESARLAGVTHPDQPELVRTLSELFDVVVDQITAAIPDEHAAQAAQAREDRRRGDLLKIARELESGDAVRPGTFVAVGDFYNFVGMVRQLATIAGATEASMAERTQQWLYELTEQLSPSFPGVMWRVAADNCVIAAPDADVTFAAVMRLNELLHTRIAEHDTDEADYVGWMRFGIAEVGPEVFSALIVAFRLSDGSKFPRGTVAMTDDAKRACKREMPPLEEKLMATGERIWLFHRPTD